jgi:hypothetical protein
LKETTVKILIWAVTGLIAVFGTLMVLLLTSAIGWLADNTAGAVDLAGRAAQWPVPPWLSAWADPATLEWLRQAITSALQALESATPWLSFMLGWVGPVIWVLWAMVLLGMFALAGGGHYLLHRKRLRSS